MVSRRELLVTLGASTLAFPRWSFAQQQKVWRVGFLEPAQLESRATLVDVFRKQLRELGYEEGRNVTYEMRFANGKLDALPALANDLVRTKVDVIVASTTPAIHAAQKATRTIPIVMSTVGDPVEAGFVASFARPGGNITGRTTQAPELMSKRVQLLRDTMANVVHSGVIWDSRNTHEIHGFKLATATATKLGMKLISLEAKNIAEIENAFRIMTREKAEAVIVFEGAVTNSYRKNIVELAMRNRLPGVYPFRDYAEAGGLMSFGAAITDNYRQAASYVDKIFRGAKPGDLPVEQPIKFELVVNMKTAAALGVTIPPTVLALADSVIT